MITENQIKKAGFKPSGMAWAKSSGDTFLEIYFNQTNDAVLNRFVEVEIDIDDLGEDDETTTQLRFINSERIRDEEHLLSIVYDL